MVTLYIRFTHPLLSRQHLWFLRGSCRGLSGNQAPGLRLDLCSPPQQCPPRGQSTHQQEGCSLELNFVQSLDYLLPKCVRGGNTCQILLNWSSMMIISQIFQKSFSILIYELILILLLGSAKNWPLCFKKLASTSILTKGVRTKPSMWYTGWSEKKAKLSELSFNFPKLAD